MKAKVDKQDINKLVNAPTAWNNVKTKVDDLDVGKSKTVPVDLKKLSDVVDNKLLKIQNSTQIFTKHFLPPLFSGKNSIFN